MADSFFDFDTDMPALEAGKDEDEMFLQNEEEMDMMNDETFGSAAQCGDWETQHEAMAGKLRSLVASHYHGYGEKEDPLMTGGSHMTYRNGADSRGESPENELEHSINQLVVDDDEEQQPAEDVSRGRPIPGRQLPVDLDNLFGPASPPSLNLVGGQENIWGSPSTQENYVQKQEEGLKMLLKQMQTAGVPQVQGGQQQFLPGNKILSHSLPDAYTLDQIEGRPAQQPQKAFTVEELERQLTNSNMPLTGVSEQQRIPSPVQSGNFPLPIGTPPSRNYMKQAGYHPQVGQLQNSHGAQGTHPQQQQQLLYLLKNQLPPATSTTTPQPQVILASQLPHQPPPALASRLANQSSVPDSIPSAAKPPALPPNPLQQQQAALLSRSLSHEQVNGSPAVTLPSQPPPALASRLSNESGRRHDAVEQRRRLSSSTSPPPAPGIGIVPMATPRPQQPPSAALVTPVVQAAGLRQSPGITPDSTELRMVQALIGGEQLPPSVKLSNVAKNLLQGLIEKRGSDPNRLIGLGEHSDFNDVMDALHRGNRDGANEFGKSPSNRTMPMSAAIVNTPPQQGMPPHSANTDPSHSRRGQNYPHGQRGSGHPRQNLFHERTRHDSSGNYPDNRDRNYSNNRDTGYHNNRDNHYNGRGRGNYYQKRSPYKNRHVGPHGDHYDDEEEDFNNQDEYAGLMSKREKDWIVKIQLMQLQTDNPYLDDYYYTLWQLKKLAKERAEREAIIADGGDPVLVLPQMSGRFEFKPYTPVQFENSLGKLTAASVHNPRQIIDVRRDNSSHKEDAKGRELRRFRQLLLDIEQAYDLLLVIDDLEKRAMALPEDQRPSVLDNRRAAIHSMFLGMRADDEETDFFRRVINVRKGIKLIARLLTMLEKHESVIMTTALFLYLGDVINKKGWIKSVLPHVYVTISHMAVMANLETLVAYVTALLSTNGATINLQNALKNEFMICVIWCLLKRGEKIYATESPLDLDVKDQKNWVSFVEQIADNLSAMTVEELPDLSMAAFTVKPVAEHFKRILDRALYLSVEDLLEHVKKTTAAKQQQQQQSAKLDSSSAEQSQQQSKS